MFTLNHLLDSVFFFFFFNTVLGVTHLGIIVKVVYQLCLSTLSKLQTDHHRHFPVIQFIMSLSMHWLCINILRWNQIFKNDVVELEISDICVPTFNDRVKGTEEEQQGWSSANVLHYPSLQWIVVTYLVMAF